MVQWQMIASLDEEHHPLQTHLQRSHADDALVHVDRFIIIIFEFQRRLWHGQVLGWMGEVESRQSVKGKQTAKDLSSNVRTRS